MDVKTQEESARPLGVIASLMAGFEMIGRHLSLIALPVLLDLLLWLGPRISVAPLVEQLVGFLVSRPAPDVATLRQVEQMATLLREFGERSNLLALLSALPLLNVPSLLAQRAPGAVSPFGEPPVLLTRSGFTVMAWSIVLLPAGLLLGFLYLNGLARWVLALRRPGEPVPAQSDSTGLSGSTGLSESNETSIGIEEVDVSSAEAGGSPVEVPAEGVAPAEGERKGGIFGADTSTGKLIRVLLFSAALLVIGMMLLPIWTLLVAAILATAPTVGVLVWSLSIGLGSYILLHFVFVIPGVLVGERGLLRAMWESILLIHTQFPSVVGFLILVVVISQGLGFVWSLPSGESWSLLVGILGNGCIATGLTAALFVFYQERVGQLPTRRRVSVKS